MKKSIGSAIGRPSSRFEAVQRSLHSVAGRGKAHIVEHRQQGRNIRFDLFSYVFGLVDESYCDLVALLDLSKENLTSSDSMKTMPVEKTDPYDDIINIMHHFGINNLQKYRCWAGEVLASWEAQALRNRLRQYPTLAQGLAAMLPVNFSENEERVKKSVKRHIRAASAAAFAHWLMLERHFPLSLLAGPVLLPVLFVWYAIAGASEGKTAGIAAERVRLAKPEAWARKLARASDKEISISILREAKPQLRERTVPFELLASIFEEGSTQLDAMEPLIYGSTPMTGVLAAISQRFHQEMTGRPNTKPILFLLSDGEPTDGDPLPIALELKRQNVHIVSCYITDEPVSQPRVLHAAWQDTWSKGAKLMYNMASNVEDVSVFLGFLRELGWKIPMKAKSFVQINHPDVLDEFVGIVLSPVAG